MQFALLQSSENSTQVRCVSFVWKTCRWKSVWKITFNRAFWMNLKYQPLSTQTQTQTRGDILVFPAFIVLGTSSLELIPCAIFLYRASHWKSDFQAQYRLCKCGSLVKRNISLARYGYALSIFVFCFPNDPGFIWTNLSWKMCKKWETN